MEGMSNTNTQEFAVEVTMKDVSEAVAKRFNEIRPRLVQKESDPANCNGRIYNGGRCEPRNLGWRFHQNLAIKLANPLGLSMCISVEEIEMIEDGEFDDVIEHTWHDAASAEYWYLHEKQWD
jgi:hypothetical protein